MGIIGISSDWDEPYYTTTSSISSTKQLSGMSCKELLSIYGQTVEYIDAESNSSEYVSFMPKSFKEF